MSYVDLRYMMWYSVYGRYKFHYVVCNVCLILEVACLSVAYVHVHMHMYMYMYTCDV